MKSSLLVSIAFVLCTAAGAQPCAGFEQYFYAAKNGLQVVVPVAYYQNRNNWYVEGHANYEQLHSFSVYAGKTFAESREFSYAVTPMIGVVWGSLKGGVLGLNTEIKYKKLLFVSQSQYIFSYNNSHTSFLYSWIELGYQLSGNVLAGVSLQHTMLNVGTATLETGVLIRLNIGEWNFPLYCFNATGDNRYLILGVTREFSFAAKKSTVALQVAP